MPEFPPAQFVEKRGGALAGRKRAAFAADHTNRRPYLARTDFAEVQMRRKARRAVLRQLIARVGVIRHWPLRETPQALQGARFARLPAFGKPRRPILPWEQFQLR